MMLLIYFFLLQVFLEHFFDINTFNIFFHSVHIFDARNSKSDAFNICNSRANFSNMSPFYINIFSTISDNSNIRFFMKAFIKTIIKLFLY